MERTRKNILDAFNRLIAKKEMEKISIDMICQEAMISKATFYRYFKDKYDVMNYNYKKLLDTYSTKEQSNSFKDLYIHLYEYGQADWKFMKAAFNYKGVNSISSYIQEYSYNLALEITKINRNGKGFSEEEKIQCDVFCFGVSHMYEKWIQDKYNTDAKKAAEALYEIMPKTIRDYWWI